MNVLCNTSYCPVILNATCVFYEADALLYTGIVNHDQLQTSLQKIDATFGNYVPNTRELTINGVTYDLSQDRIWVVTGGHVIQDEGISLPNRTNLNFVGAGVTATDDAGNDATIITIPGGGGASYITSVSNTSTVNLDVTLGDLTASFASLNISQFTNDSGYITSSALTGYVQYTRTLTINGTSFDLSANRSWNVGTVTNVTATSPLFSSGGATPDITIQQSSSSQNGYLSSTDWVYFNGKVDSLSAGTGISIGGTALVPIVTNTAPDQTVVLNNGTGISISGTYPNFTITNTAPSSGGTVTSVSGTTNRITSTGGATPVIDIDSAYDALWQPVDADLTAIAALGFVSTSFLKKTAANTWALDTNTYLTQSSISDAAYSGSWDGDTTIAPSKNAIYDKIETLTNFTSTIGASFDGQGSVLLVETLTSPFRTKNSGTITGYYVSITGSGTITFDIWKIASGTAAPTAANTIVASAPPTLTTGATVKSTTLTGWTTSYAADDVWIIKITAVTGTITQSTIQLF